MRSLSTFEKVIALAIVLIGGVFTMHETLNLSLSDKIKVVARNSAATNLKELYEIKCKDPSKFKYDDLLQIRLSEYKEFAGREYDKPC